MVNTKSIILISALASFLITGFVYASSSTFFISNDTLFLDDKLTATGSLKVNNGKLEIDYVGSATHLKIHDKDSTLTAKKFFDIVADTGNKLKFKDSNGSELLEIDGASKGFVIKKSLKILSNLFSLGFEDLTDPSSKSFVFGSTPANTFLFNNVGTAGGWNYKSPTTDLMNISSTGAITLGSGVKLNTNGNGITNLQWANFSGNPVGGQFVSDSRDRCEFDDISEVPQCTSEKWMDQWGDGDKNASLENVDAGFGILRVGNEFSLEFETLLHGFADGLGKSFEALETTMLSTANHKFGLKRIKKDGTSPWNGDVELTDKYDIDFKNIINVEFDRSASYIIANGTSRFADCKSQGKFICGGKNSKSFDSDGDLKFICCTINLAP